MRPALGMQWIGVDDVMTATSGIHIDRASLDRQARLIVSVAYP